MENRLRETRRSQGLTQKQLAHKARVSRTILSGIESGAVTVTTTRTLCKIARGLGKSVGDIFFTPGV